MIETVWMKEWREWVSRARYEGMPHVGFLLSWWWKELCSLHYKLTCSGRNTASSSSMILSCNMSPSHVHRAAVLLFYWKLSAGKLPHGCTLRPTLPSNCINVQLHLKCPTVGPYILTHVQYCKIFLTVHVLSMHSSPTVSKNIITIVQRVPQNPTK